MSPIPKSIINLLGQEWRPANGYSAFESNFEGKRKSNPSYYTLNPGKEVTSDMDTFSYKEAAAMSKDDLISKFISNKDGVLWMNEHASHAVQDFCSEVYDAWRKCQDRLRQIP